MPALPEAKVWPLGVRLCVVPAPAVAVAVFCAATVAVPRASLLARLPLVTLTLPEVGLAPP